MKKIKNETWNEKIVWLLTVILFALFYIMDTDPRISKILFVVTIFITVVSLQQHRFQLYFKPEPFHCFVLLFSIYCFVSSIWAYVPSYSIEKGITIFELLVCMSLIYSHYSHFSSSDILVKALLFGGYTVGVYSLYAYGVSNILRIIASGMRLDNDYTNINLIGMVCAIAVIITVYYLITDRFRIYMIFSIPCVFMVAGSGSRKALVMMLLGTFLIVLLRYSSRNIIKNIVKFLIIFFIAYLALSALMSSQLFSAANSRMEGLINLFTGSGKVDSSALKRQAMIGLGIDTFKQHPIFGIGIGNTRIINNIVSGAYLHNNYIEILAGGGIVGLTIYYAPYVYLLYKLIQNRFYSDMLSKLLFVLIIVNIVMDYGAVTYYNKSTYFYLMIYFLHIRNENRKMEGYYED